MTGHATPRDRPRVVVAVLTYRRHDALARVVPMLVDHARWVSDAGTADVEVLVVDNDPDGGAKRTVSSVAGARYAHEPRPGISAARNRALDEAHAGQADALVFIDDDEVPAEHWLELLVTSWREWHCAAVSGPVRAEFEGAVDPWVAASGAFEPRDRRTGERVPGAATNNLLLDLSDLARLGLRFDERLGLTGGEDTVLTHELVHRGGEIRWCAEAAVIEPVAAERATRRWVLRRTYRAGTSWSGMELRLCAGPAARLRCRASLLARGVANVVLGAGGVIGAVARADLRKRALAEVRVVSYCGMLTGIAGGRLAEYRR